MMRDGEIAGTMLEITEQANASEDRLERRERP